MAISAASKSKARRLNIGTYVGSAQVREAVIGDDDRLPTPAELEQMKSLVEQAMKDGALGLSARSSIHRTSTRRLMSLSLSPKSPQDTADSMPRNMRSEGASEMPALAEAIRIGREANLPVEIFHLKVSGKPRWGSMKNVVATIQLARDSGSILLRTCIPTQSGATALASALPPWVADGGVQNCLSD